MYFDKLKLGQKVTLEPAVIEKDRMLEFAERYANVPIHADEEYARSTHFGQLLAPGVMTFLEVWAKYLEKDLFGEELLAGKSTKIEWYAPVFAGDTLCGEAEITALTDRNPKNGLAELTIRVFNQEKVHVLDGIIETVVKKT